MIVAFPVTPHDKHLVPHVKKAFTAVGAGAEHSAAVFSGPSCQEEAADLASHLEEFFFKVERVQWDRDPVEGWPKGPNDCFRRVALAVGEMEGDEPFLFFELDATPTRRGWLDALSQDYRAQGKAFMGVVRPTLRVYRDGRVVAEGDHMVGCGIYPHVFYRDSLVLRSLDSLNPFDVQVQYEVRTSRAHTELMGHHFNTCNYRFEGDDVVCDDVGDREMYGVTYAGVVESLPLIHGCKDGSLAEIVAKNTEHPAPKVGKAATAPALKEPPAAPPFIESPSVPTKALFSAQNGYVKDPPLPGEDE